MTSKQLFKKIRAHVAEYGITGGNFLNQDEAICPRGLVRLFGDEGSRGIFDQPVGKAQREVMDALDSVVKHHKITDSEMFVLPAGLVSGAEAYCHVLSACFARLGIAADSPCAIKIALDYIDAAAELV